MNFVYIGFHGYLNGKIKYKKNKIFKCFKGVNDVDQKYFTDLIWFMGNYIIYFA